MAGTVTHLDTINFDQTVSDFANYIRAFEEICRTVDRITDTLCANWKGDGAKAFERDCGKVKLNLKDLSEIMYDLRDVLVDAHAEYVKSDLEMSKAFES